ncbi:MAG: DUF4124 domain-containing protein [Halioglobus sp.]|nr:DUF4124 domain-containing protein [Halioglobus sp.]
MKQAVRILALLWISSILALGGLYSNAAEVLYRWVDDRGNPVHSDRPPPEGTDYEVISTESKFVRPVDAGQGAVPREVEPRVGNEFEPVDKAAQEPKKNPEFCQRARDNLEALNTRPRLRVRDDETGEYKFLNEEEKEQRRQQAREAIEFYCE